MSTRKVSARARVAELEHQLTQERRAFGAMAEWFICEGRGHATQELCVIGTHIRVIVHGMTRGAGGVCVVEIDGYRDFPRYLDDVCNEWSRDSAAEIRDAARILLLRRDEQNAARVAS
jgi:hypothetical protein